MPPIHTPYGHGELRLYTPYRRPIGVAWPVRAINVAWPEGAAVFTVPQESRTWSTTYARELNLVEYHDARLSRVWCGYIVDHQQDEREVQIICNPAEQYYRGRNTDWIWGAYYGRAGEIFTLLHNAARSWGYFPIELGEIDLSGPDYNVEFQMKNCYEGMNEVAEASGGRWWVEKLGHAHEDPWVSRFATKVGRYLVNDVLLCGEIIDPPNPKRSAADFASDAFVIGGGRSAELDDRIKLYIPNSPARMIHGLWQSVIDLGQEPLDPTLIYQLGLRRLEELSTVGMDFGLNIDNRFGVFDRFWIGDTIRVMLSRAGYVGYDGPARVLGIQLDIDGNKMGLVLEGT